MEPTTLEVLLDGLLHMWLQGPVSGLEAVLVAEHVPLEVLFQQLIERGSLRVARLIDAARFLHAR